MKHELENYYPGDDAWYNFVQVFSGVWNDCDCQDEIIQKLNGQKDIAMVIYGINGNNWATWIDLPIPALDGVSPVECVVEPMLVKRLRTMLMRLPWI